MNTPQPHTHTMFSLSIVMNYTCNRLNLQRCHRDKDWIGWIVSNWYWSRRSAIAERIEILSMCCASHLYLSIVSNRNLVVGKLLLWKSIGSLATVNGWCRHTHTHTHLQITRISISFAMRRYHSLRSIALRSRRLRFNGKMIDTMDTMQPFHSHRKTLQYVYTTLTFRYMVNGDGKPQVTGCIRDPVHVHAYALSNSNPFCMHFG